MALQVKRSLGFVSKSKNETYAVLDRFRDKPMCDVKVKMKALDFSGFAEALEI